MRLWQGWTGKGRWIAVCLWLVANVWHTPRLQAEPFDPRVQVAPSAQRAQTTPYLQQRELNRARSTDSPPAPKLTLAEKWQHEIALSPDSPVQIGTRESLLVAPTGAMPGGDPARLKAGLLVIDGATGGVVRFIEAPGADTRAPVGVAIDADYAVFASADGVLAKAHLDGTYAWVAGQGEALVAMPLLRDLDADGVADVMVVTAKELRAFHGRTGKALGAIEHGCEKPVLQRPAQAEAAVNVACLGGESVTSTRYEWSDGHWTAGSSSAPVLERPIDSPDADAPTCLLDALGQCSPRYVDPGAAPMGGPVGELLVSGGIFDDNRTGALVRGTAGVKLLVREGREAIRVAENEGVQLPWREIVTASVSDLAGDGKWDLIVATGKALGAFATLGSGDLYQAVPYGDLSCSNALPDACARPGARGEVDPSRYAGEPVVTAMEFAQGPEPESRPWSYGGSRRILGWPRASPPLLTWWSDTSNGVPVERFPLLEHAQSLDGATYFHDAAEVFALDPASSAIAQPKLKVPAAIAHLPIIGLAVTSSHFVVLRGGFILACSREGGACDKFSAKQMSSVEATADHKLVWVGSEKGYFRTFNPGAAKGHSPWGHEFDATKVGSIHALQQLDGKLIVSGPKGTLVFALDGNRPLDRPAESAIEVQQVLRCAANAPLYALGNGDLLEVPAHGPFAPLKVRDQPGHVRRIACDASGDLILLSSEGGARVVRGPLQVPWALLLLCIGAALSVVGALVLINYGKQSQHAGKSAHSVRRAIDSEQPLTSLADGGHGKLRTLVEGLSTFIDNRDTRPPVTVGIFGPWGSGKSSVMRLLEANLKARRRYISVWFNPWRFHREDDISAALLQCVVEEVNTQAGLGRVIVALRKFFSAANMVRLCWLVPLTLIGLHVACFPHYWGASARELLRTLELPEVSTTISAKAAGTSILTFSGGTAIYRFIQRLLQIFDFRPSEKLRSQDHEQRVDFIRHFSAELSNVLDALPRAERVVIFVDDLDRCPPKQIVGMLEALNLLTESQRCYFVLGMDPRMVRDAIEVEYADLIKRRKESGADESNFGASYLEKIITLAVHVPEVDPDDLSLPSQGEPKQQHAAPGLLGRMLGASLRWVTAFPGRTLMLGWLILCLWLGAQALSISPLQTLPVANEPDGTTPAAGKPAAPATAGGARTDPALAGVPGKSDTPNSQPRGSRAPDQGQKYYRRVVAGPPKPRPLEPLTRASVTAEHSAETPLLASRQTYYLSLVLSAFAFLALMYLALVLWLAHSSRAQYAEPSKDSDDFQTWLSRYRKCLARNPRQLIRQSNSARFYYYLVAKDLPEDAANLAGFFHTLLANQLLRPLADGENLAENAWAGAVQARPENGEKVEQVLVRLAPFRGETEPSKALREDLTRWMRDTGG